MNTPAAGLCVRLTICGHMLLHVDLQYKQNCVKISIVFFYTMPTGHNIHKAPLEGVVESS